MELQLKVKNYLKINGIKKNYLASKLGIHSTQLSQWFAGKYELNSEQIQVIKELLK